MMLPLLTSGQVSIVTFVSGYIIDNETKEPIPFASIVLDSTNLGTTSNIDGFFKLAKTSSSKIIRVTSIGYEPAEVDITNGKTESLRVLMKAKTVELGEVQIRPEKTHYKNKNNPAVEIINNVIKHKELNKSENLNFLAFDKYDKTQFALSNLGDKFINHKSFKKFSFIFDNIDNKVVNGIKILPLYMKEVLSEHYYQKDPKEIKEIIKADKMVNFDGYLDRQGMSEYLNFMYQKINIYDKTITLATNIFLSPIAPTAPAFYKYFIEDTLSLNGVDCIKLVFVPRNKVDMLFDGFLYIVKDSSYAVKKIEMSVNKQINQNWIKDVRITQEFDKIQDISWLLKTDEISIDFGIKENSMGILGKRTAFYNNYRINDSIPSIVFKGPEVIHAEDATEKNPEFWEKNRPIELTNSERGIYSVADSIKKVPAFKRTLDVLFLLTEGYKDIGMVEIGPVYTFCSYNPIEGYKLRLGGRTTPKFSQKMSFDSYLAYGFADKKFKYYLGTTYSLTNSDIYHFPVKSIKISLQNETSTPGQDIQFIQEDNILLSFKRGINDKLFYNKTLKIDLVNEFENHFSYRLSYALKTLGPGGSLYFDNYRTDIFSTRKEYINVSEVSVNLRYAPQEKFYQGKQSRTQMINKSPIINLYYNMGSTMLGNDYNYHNLKINIIKRFYPGILGFTDVILEAGKIFGTVPYPLLYVHRANQNYSYQVASYNMMNFLEFVSDEYASLIMDHHFNGFIFNKIPLAKKLKLREVVSAKILFGNLSDNNNPSANPDLFKFPVDNQGAPITFSLEKKPYIEVSAGLDNIFKFIRVDLVKRLTYLDHPNVSGLGVRVRFKMDF